MVEAVVIQGGMGVAVSGWRLARAVAAAGQLGVVSGTAIDTVHARLLQDGDPGGHLRRAYRQFPVPGVADRVLRRWSKPGGRLPKTPYRPVPRLTTELDRAHRELVVVANFAEVWLAKDGHDGPVGVNHLEKIQLATLPSLYGALLADVDVVLMGAGIPAAVPSVLDDLAALRPARLRIDVAGAGPGDEHAVTFDPVDDFGAPPSTLRRPELLAIVSSVTLARFLARDPATRPDGFVVEAPSAGGHNAPPRGPLRLDERGQTRYGPRDDVDLTAVADLGLPFWVAGSCGTPEALRAALATGARGVQVGTPFALCEESGMATHLRDQVLRQVVRGDVEVVTDPAASPSGFPFKVTAVPGTVSDRDVREGRRRVCDLGYLRTPYVRPDGDVGYRCPAEPVDSYVAKGGDPADTVGRACLCNGLTATVGLAQVRRRGVEPALVTTGADLDPVRRLLAGGRSSYRATDVLDLVLAGADGAAATGGAPG